MAIANINIADFIKEGSNITFTTSDEGRIITIASSGGGGGTPGGADTNVQYNDGGSFGGKAAFTYNKTTNTLTVDAINLNGETASRIVATDGSKNLDTPYTFYDEDAMTSNSATGIPSQQSVKAYVDNFITVESFPLAVSCLTMLR